MDADERHLALKRKIGAGKPTLGLFVRTPSHHVVEILGGTGLDLIVLDAEHAPFGRAELDVCLMAARAAGLPALVRVPDDAAATILNVLDLGAAGIMVPHVDSAEKARRIVEATRYERGTRGFSASHRAAGFGASPHAEYRMRSDRSVMVIPQIENRAGMNSAAAIAAVDGVDALFIGPADLAVALGADSSVSPAVENAVETVAEAVRAASRPVGLAVASLDSAERPIAAGITLLIVSTEQALLRAAVCGLSAQFERFGS